MKLKLRTLHMCDNRRLFIALSSAIVLLKLCLATLTPLGFDFVYAVSNVITKNVSTSWSPWFIWVRSAYEFWLWLPVDHGDVMRGITDPGLFLLPSHYLLSAVVKAPLLLSDVVVALLIYRLTLRLYKRENLARLAVLLWLANPFATFFIEMWGSMDIILLALSLASVLAALSRVKLSALAVGAGIALRLNPVIVWLALTAWLIRRKTLRWDLFAVIMAGPLGIFGYLFWISRGQILTSAVEFLVSSDLLLTYTPFTQTISEYSAPFGEVYIFGLATMLVTLFFMIASSIWSSEDSAIIPLVLSGTLLLYGLANWFPPAFLWAIPFLAIWNAENLRSKYPIALYFALAIFLAVFHSTELTLTSQSFLFLPLNLVPFGNLLVRGLESANQLRTTMNLGLLIQSGLAGVSLAFAGSITWKSIRGAEHV